MDQLKKSFTQACNNHSVLKIEIAQQILRQLSDEYEVTLAAGNDALQNIVKDINTKLNIIDQSLVFVMHPILNEEFLVFAITCENKACKFQPRFSEDEKHLFYKILYCMANSEDLRMPWQEVYNVMPVTSSQKPLAKSRIQELVALWTKQGYICEKNDHFYIGPRTMVEFDSFLKTHFPDNIADCPLCHKTAFWTLKCNECNAKIHKQCLRTFLRKTTKCPACKKKWNQPLE